MEVLGVLPANTNMFILTLFLETTQTKKHCCTPYNIWYGQGYSEPQVTVLHLVDFTYHIHHTLKVLPF
jgi:hypothetical protein